MTKERACAKAPGLSRRTLLTALPASGVALSLPSTGHANELSDLVEGVMDTVIPCSPNHVFVSMDKLRALCEAAGKEWAEHWAQRGKGRG
ncbi:MAG: hypothetical protein ACU0DX_17005 [Roseovarius sp.]|uniref:hypothetical protein n=1 Tax=Roseovarius sp. TaxID=1486281 RepID=UPI0040581C30